LIKFLGWTKGGSLQLLAIGIAKGEANGSDFTSSTTHVSGDETFQGTLWTDRAI